MQELRAKKKTPMIACLVSLYDEIRALLWTRGELPHSGYLHSAIVDGRQDLHFSYVGSDHITLDGVRMPTVASHMNASNVILCALSKVVLCFPSSCAARQQKCPEKSVGRNCDHGAARSHVRLAWRWPPTPPAFVKLNKVGGGSMGRSCGDSHFSGRGTHKDVSTVFASSERPSTPRVVMSK